MFLRKILVVGIILLSTISVFAQKKNAHKIEVWYLGDEYTN
jgi:hypothetical protein